MKSRVTQISAIAALALGLGLSAGQANAAQGTFNLPFKVYWGKTTLEPGQYKIHYDNPGAAFQIFTVTGNRRSHFVIPFEAEPNAHLAASYLRVERVGDAYYVREFASGLAGRNYTFKLPKATRQLTAGRVEGTSLSTIAVTTTR